MLDKIDNILKKNLIKGKVNSILVDSCERHDERH
jgi:hypothetical protein